LILTLYRRALSALAAVKSDGDAVLLREAQRDARRIERERMPWGDALAHLVRAGIARFRGDRTAALQHLSAGEAGLEVARMSLYAAAARRRRGELAGGAEGRALMEAADAWMTGQLVRNPIRMAAMLVPRASE
jgi:hypothetical protein